MHLHSKTDIFDKQPQYRKPVQSIVACDDGRTLVTCTIHKIQSWGVDEKGELREEHAHGLTWDLLFKEYVGFSKSTGHLLFAMHGNADIFGGVLAWNIKNGVADRIIGDFKGREAHLLAVGLLPGGMLAMTYNNHLEPTVWDISTKSLIHRFLNLPANCKGFSVNSAGNVLGLLLENGMLSMVEPGTWKEASITGSQGWMISGLGKLKGGYLKYVSSPGIIKLRASHKHNPHVRILQNLVDGTPDIPMEAETIMRETGNNPCEIVDLTDGSVLVHFDGDPDETDDLQISENRKYCLSVANKTLRLTDLETGLVIGEYRSDARLSCCSFSPDNQTIWVGDHEGFVHCLDIR
jgi:WD40 repeat protein